MNNNDKAKIQEKIDFFMNILSQQHKDGFYEKIVEIVEIAENRNDLTHQEKGNLVSKYKIFENFYRLIEQIAKEEDITSDTNDNLEFLSKIFPNIEITKWYQNKLLLQLFE